jgi:hypothetical protein
VKIEPRLSGARGAGGSTGSGGGASGGATPKKKTSGLSGDVHFHVREANFHGVRDISSLKRQVLADADRRARSSRDSALHDIDVG